MAKMMKRLMALVLVLSMLTGVISLPASAEDDTQSGGEMTVTVEITNESGEVIGEKTTVTTMDTTETPSDYNQEIKTDSTWTTQETEGSAGESLQEGNTTTQTSSQVVTDVTGSETSTDSTHSDKDSGVQTYSGTTVGSEDTTVTDTTTTVTTTTGVVLEQKTEGPTTTIDGEVEEEDWSDLIPTEEGDWDKTGGEDNEFQPVPGTEETTKPTYSDIDVDNDPLDDEDVTLTMTAPTGSAPSTDEQELFISIEDALENDIAYADGETLDDGSTVKYKYDDKGNVLGYTITKITPTGDTPGDIVPGTTGDAVPQGEEIKTYIKPEGYTVCTDEPIVNENGEQIGTKTIEEILDEAGTVIGYTITEKVTSSSGAQETTDSLPTPAPTYTLPERPVAPDPVTENGLTTTVTVEDVLDENGKVTGYKTTKTVTDEKGGEISVESETIYGTATTYSSTLTSTPTSDEVVTTTVTTVYGTLTTQNYTKTTPGTKTDVATRDVTQDVYNLVETKDGLFFLYEGKMYRVQALSGHGAIDVESATPQLDLTPAGDGAVSESTDLRNPHYNNYVDVTYGENYTVDVGAGYDYKYIGYGLESAITANTGSANGTLVHQFKLQDEEGNFHYVLCADYNTTAFRDTDYDMKNVEDASYYSASDAQKIQAIVTKGYWGTDSGVGSLENVKTFLKEKSNVSDEILNGLTHGEALTATQAALWYYGHSSNDFTMSATDAAAKEYAGGSYWYDGDRCWYYEDLDANEESRVNELYKALIGLTAQDAPNNSTELLAADNFATTTELVIKEKATDESGNVKTHNGKEKYVADLTFTVDVKKSDLTGNLVVTITDKDGNQLHDPIQVATEESNLLGQYLASEKAGSTDIILRDLELPEGTRFNLNLSGTQNIALGAYLYSAEVYSASQTFVGLGSGTQDVNLNVQMEFSVTDPEAKVSHTTTTWKEKEVDTEAYTKVDHYKKEKKGTSTSQTVSVNTTVIGTTVQTDVTTRETDQHREWKYGYLYEVVPSEEGGDDGLTEIIDEEVPLADAPRTGDITVILLLACLFSAGGLVLLNRKKEEV